MERRNYKKPYREGSRDGRDKNRQTNYSNNRNHSSTQRRSFSSANSDTYSNNDSESYSESGRNSNFENRSERRPYRRNDSAEQRGEKRFSSREDRPRYNSSEGSRRPRRDEQSSGSYEKRNDRYSSEERSERRPYQRRGDSSEQRNDRRFSSREDRPRYNSSEGNRRPRRDEQSSGSYEKRNDRHSSEERSERRPYQRRSDSSEQRNDRYSNEERSERKPFQRRNDSSEHRSDNRFSSRDSNSRRRRDENSSGSFGKRNDRFSSNRKSGFSKDRDFDSRDKRSSGRTQENRGGLVRLNKYISNAGICSRREADVLIQSGAVSVNGEIVTEMGYKVKPTDIVHYGGERLVSEKKQYILLNKPKGYITTMEDPQERKTVMYLIHGACKERVYPVGRLDRNTMGLLLFTNDGEMTKKLTHPSHGARKLYQVELDKPVTKRDMEQIINGIELEDGFINVDKAEYIDGMDKKNVGVELHSGKNRIVRRIFEHLGYKVVKLDRVMFAGLTKKTLQRGYWRQLTDKEVQYLKMI